MLGSLNINETGKISPVSFYQIQFFLFGQGEYSENFNVFEEMLKRGGIRDDRSISELENDKEQFYHSISMILPLFLLVVD